eukprot:scaffold417156_cov22-Prasinocladus_malaysianus.AAC.2
MERQPKPGVRQQNAIAHGAWRQIIHITSVESLKIEEQPLPRQSQPGRRNSAAASCLFALFHKRATLAHLTGTARGQPPEGHGHTSKGSYNASKTFHYSIKEKNRHAYIGTGETLELCNYNEKLDMFNTWRCSSKSTS